MKKAISLLLLFATILGCCAGIISCNKNNDGDNGDGSTSEAPKLNYSTETLVDFNQASVITGSGLTATTDNVKTASNGGVWNTKTTTVSLGFSKTDLSSYKEISVWINNTSDQRIRVKFALLSDNATTTLTDSYGVRLNVHPGWHQYTLPFSELTQTHENLIPSAVETLGTPLGLNSISALTLENLSSKEVELVIDSVYVKTQKYGTFEGQDYTQLEKAVCFYEDSNAYLYDQLRCVLNESDTEVAVKADSNTTFIPVAILAEHRGATDIKASKEKVSFKYNGTDYEFTPDKAIEYVGVSTGKQPGRSVSSKSIVRGEYLMIPMEKCAEIFGYELFYDKTGLVIFSDTKNIFASSDTTSDFNKLFELIDVIAFTNYTGAELLDNMDELYPEDGHTRVMMNDADFDRLKGLLETDPTYANWFKQFEAKFAKGTAAYNNSNYKFEFQDGYRLLMVSRDVMGQLVPYAFLYKMTDNPDYAEKCYKVMLQTTKFVDKEITGSPSWHPEHFLDTGELMYGYSIAYDWCYDAFDDEQRGKLESAIWELGYGAAFGWGELYNFWADYNNDAEFKKNFLNEWKEEHGEDFDKYTWNRAPYQVTSSQYTGVREELDRLAFNFNRPNWTNNWNGVCNGGMVTMALAFANVNSEFREWSEYLLDCCMYTIPVALAESYGPDGGYPESPGYWSYGTNYSIHFMQGLSSACGTDIGYINSPGFRESFYFMNYVSSPANGQWPYHDTGAGMPDMYRFFWFADKGNDPDIGKLYYDAILDGRSSVESWTLMWYNPDNISTGDVSLSLDQCYYGIDTATFRSDWSTKAIFAGLHGGYNAANHGNHDIGNFILEMDGIRFFTDLGSEEYNLKNPAYAPGVLFFSTPYRYWFYRERAEGSNTLVINPIKVDISNKTGSQYSSTSKNYDQNHTADSQIQAFFSGETSAYAVVDMDCAYNVDAKPGTTGVRGLYLTENRSTVVIQDEMTLKNTKNEVYWMGHIIKGGEIQISEDKKTAIITYEGVSMVCSIVVPEGYKGDFKFQRMTADYLPVTGLTTSTGEYDRSGMQKLVAYSDNCPQDLKLAIVCRLLNDGTHNYTWTDIKDWTID